MLRAARERQGLSLEDVAARTRVRPALLRALEEGRYDALPGPVYTRGFLKLYARAVGLDPAAVVAAWEQEAQARAGSAPRPAAPPGPPQRERPRPWWHPDPVLQSMDPRQRLRSAASATLVVVLAAVVGAWLLSAATKGPAQQEVAHPTVSLEPAPQPPTQPGGMPGLAGEAGGPTGLPGESLAPPPVPAPPAAPSPAPAASGEPAAAGGGGGPEASAPSTREGDGPGVEVVAVVREPGWIEAFADGQRIYSETARAGERLVWRARERLSLRLEKAEGVDLVVNGRPVGPAGWGITTLHFSPTTEEGSP